jgi:NAD(P)-dependent dehydrogenase (short-subunit alcohol dehydrogenase family)
MSEKSTIKTMWHHTSTYVGWEPGSVRDFAAVVASAGNIDVLVNAAGIDARALGAAPDQRGPFEIDVEHFLAEVRVNAAGPMLVTRALLPQLVHGSPAKVVNLSSRLASMTVGAELCWDIGYNASKAALNSVTVRTARLLADTGVIVVAVHPGWVRTAMGGPEATLSPEEAAQRLIELSTRSLASTAGCSLPRTEPRTPGEPGQLREHNRPGLSRW